MKKNSILRLVSFLIVLGFGLQTAYAQITITLPKIQIPKFKKEKPNYLIQHIKRTSFYC
jgi:hypothetical protein